MAGLGGEGDRLCGRRVPVRWGLCIRASPPSRADSAPEAEEVEFESDNDDCSDLSSAGAVGTAVGDAVAFGGLCESDSESLEDEEDEDGACLRFLLRIRRFPGPEVFGGGIGKGANSRFK